MAIGITKGKPKEAPGQKVEKTNKVGSWAYVCLFFPFCKIFSSPLLYSLVFPFSLALFAGTSRFFVDDDEFTK